jgi:hypothetical protein
MRTAVVAAMKTKKAIKQPTTLPELIKGTRT